VRTQILYHRKGGRPGYQVVDTATGEVFARFGSGSYEKYLAERLQLQVEQPQVLRLADRVAAKYPELRKRALRAGFLYVAGHVHLNGSERVYDVRSQNGGGLYVVDLNSGTCSCADWEGALLGRKYSAPWCGGKPVCKHIVAAHMYEMMDRG